MSLLPVKICMNELCGATTTAQWKRGWPMKVGGVATLCYACGYGSFSFPFYPSLWV
ncbi:putative transcription factor C2C2-GATA family [Helianthus annuus]|nr:putative transcription factor C2C2-GATA family [Helianthus annuus]